MSEASITSVGLTDALRAAATKVAAWVKRTWFFPEPDDDTNGAGHHR